MIIVVPLVVDEDAKPDFGAMDAATRGRRRGPATRDAGVVRDDAAGRHDPESLRRRARRELSGLELGADLFVVHSPERVFSGRIFADLRRYPKLVGGVDEASTARGVEFYESFLEFDERA